MYTQQAELCKLLLRERFGPIVEAVAAVIIRDGRLALGGIVSRTTIAPLSVRQALAVLIQHSLVTHAQSKEGPRMATYYSISLHRILRLQRVGLYLALVEERMGKEGLAVFRTIMLNGCMAISSVREVLGFKQLSEAAKQKFNTAVARLVRERFISAATPKDSITKADRIMQEEAREIEKLDMPPTAKELVKIRQKISEREEEEYQTGEVVGMKRQARDDGNDDFGGASKVLIGPDGQPITLEAFYGNQQQRTAEAEAVDEKQCFRVYYGRLDVFLRNKQIANYFSDKYNDAAGALMKTLLRLSEPSTKTCRDKISGKMTANHIIQNIPQDAQLEDMVETGGDMFFQKLTDADDGSSSNAQRVNRGKAAFALLDILRRDSSGIVFKSDERGAGEFRINFERAAVTLRDQCLDTLILEKFGSLEARIVRVLRDKQKLDEKTIATTAMMPAVQCRERLHELSLAGFVDTVEIPRTADRNPSRMFYLWYLNPPKQVSAALRGIFQGISNIIQRSSKEANSRAALVAKSKREDVVADQSLLADAEKKELKTLGGIRRNLDAAAVRLDSMLLLINDIAPCSATR
ncbi:RNA polymerase III subunit C82 [Coemansia sp. RSA 1365]|nr:RNA polymerase III subunit C82 [Coemansia sp. RSA 1365]